MSKREQSPFRVGPELHESSSGLPHRRTARLQTAAYRLRGNFLNVIESVFSGMARAVIQNSNYASVDEAKAAIDRYFEERNTHRGRWTAISTMMLPMVIVDRSCGVLWAG
jgi:hypothetical protein